MFGHYNYTYANDEYKHQHYEVAANYYLKALKSGELGNPDFYNALLKLGRSFLYLGKGIGSDCDNEDWVIKGDEWTYKGECHFIFGQYNKTIEAYQKQSDVTKNYKKDVTSSHITYEFHGNTGNVNFGGIQASDDAVINKSHVFKNDIPVMSDKIEVESHDDIAFCPECGQKVDSSDKFCRKCGRKLQ